MLKASFSHLFLLSSTILLISVLSFILKESYFVSQNHNNPPITLPSKKPTIQAQSTLRPTKAPQSIPKNFGKSVNVPIVYYHYISNNPDPTDKARDNLQVTPDKFEAQMSYLASQSYTTISLDTLYAALLGNTPLPPKPIILTFDDGYEDFYTNAFPILSKYNLHATVFIPTGLIDQGFYLKWDQIRKMDSSGLISFQAHSVTHPNLISLSPEEFQYEILESKRVLEEKLRKPVNSFAYPYGSSNSATWEAVKKAGFLGAVGTWYGMTQSEGNILDMPRVRIGSNWTLEDFATRI